MGNQAEAAQKGLDIVLKNNNSIAIFSNRGGALMLKI